jgi:hypothetical protein
MVNPCRALHCAKLVRGFPGQRDLLFNERDVFGATVNAVIAFS